MSEKYRDADGWLRDKSVEQRASEAEPPTAADITGGCLLLAGAGIIAATMLVSMGIGYENWGVSGLLVGAGVGLAAPLGLIAGCAALAVLVALARKKPKKDQ